METIYHFLGQPHQATALGLEILSLPDDSLSHKIDHLFNPALRPNRQITQLQSSLKQLNVTQEEFNLSRAMLLNQIHRWKEAASSQQQYDCSGYTRQQNRDQYNVTPPPNYLQLHTPNTARFQDSVSTNSGLAASRGSTSIWRKQSRPPGTFHGYPASIYDAGSCDQSLTTPLPEQRNIPDFLRTFGVHNDERWQSTERVAPSQTQMRLSNSTVVVGSTAALMSAVGTMTFTLPNSKFTASQQVILEQKVGITRNEVEEDRTNLSEVDAATMCIGDVAHEISQAPPPSRPSIHLPDMLQFLDMSEENRDNVLITPPSDSSTLCSIPRAPHSSPVMCGSDYLQRTSPDHPTALEMMREVSLRLDPTFSEWDNPKLLAISLRQLLDNNTPSAKIVSKDENNGLASQETGGMDVCSTQAGSSRDSVRTSVSSSTSYTPCRTNQWPQLTSFSVAEQYIYSCLYGDSNPPPQPMVYENCMELLQLSFKPTSIEIDQSSAQLELHLSRLAWGCDTENTRRGHEQAEVIQGNLNKLPNLLSLIEEAAQTSRKCISKNIVDQLGQQSVGGLEQLGTFSPLEILNLEGISVTDLTENLVRQSAARIDLEIIRLSGCLGDQCYEEKLREKVYAAMMSLLEEIMQRKVSLHSVVPRH